MAVKLSVVESCSQQHQKWWVNFCMGEVKLVSSSRQNYYHPLSKWGGKMLHPGPWIEFENDADATAFLLRWS